MKLNSGFVSTLSDPLVMLVTVPTVIAVSLALTGYGFVWLDAQMSWSGDRVWPFVVSSATARAFLSSVAGGAITALSLTYSLVLLVFTLAAANIGPRLLRRFTSEPTNQVTAGVLGGTFLYALTVLYFVENDFVPQLAVGLASVLATLSVVQLIVFVRHVSRSVTIDEEIADISGRLTSDIETLVREAGAPHGHTEIQTETRHSIASPASGYIGAIDEEGLVELAKAKGTAMRLSWPAGHFVLSDAPLVHLGIEPDEETVTEVLERISIDETRSASRNVEFSIHLLVEIGLRALSPGTNDTYTAITCTDRLAAALELPIRRGLKSMVRSDEDGEARLYIPGLSLSQLVGSAFHPLRRATSDNILMAQRLGGAIGALYEVAGDDGKEVLERHAELLLAMLKETDQMPSDIESVAEWLGSSAKKAKS